VAIIEDAAHDEQQREEAEGELYRRSAFLPAAKP
jgi:hypothetical protein